MALKSQTPDWLRQYGNAQGYQWQKRQRGGGTAFFRPLGFIEFAFEGDGRHAEGRADINDLLEVEIKSTLTEDTFRERILLAWTCLRCRHSLLRAKTVQDHTLDPNSFAPYGLHFQVDVLDDVQEAQDDAKPYIEFLADRFEHVDPLDFYYQSQNCARVINSERSQSRLFVLPVETRKGKSILRFLLVGSHCIWDGLSCFAWTRDFVQLLNDPIPVLQRKIISAIDPGHLAKSLPLPQEALYPPISGSIARQRWFWAIVRILRHVRRPLRPGIPNPLLRRGPPVAPTALPPTYHPVLPYSRLPVLTTQLFTATIPLHAAHRLHRICRETGTSIGAGCFALVALVQMELHEALSAERNDGQTTTEEGEKDDFIAGFPLDARAFVADRAAVATPESMMLTFSDGIALPFLSRELDLGGRIRVLARRAHAQLGAYQKKRPRSRRRGTTTTTAAAATLTSRGADLVLANSYLAGRERMARVLPEDLRAGTQVQGAYPLRANPTAATHGISSVGMRDALLTRGQYRLDDPGKDFAADFADLTLSVRAREGEFLVAIGGFEDGIYVMATADMSRIDPVLAERWRARMENILDDLDDAVEAKL